MLSNHYRNLFVLAAMLSCASWPLCGRASDDAAQAKARAKETAEFAAREMKRYRFEAVKTDDGESTEIKVRDGAVLNWSNPVRGEIYGSVYVWTEAGRPQAFVCVYRFFTAPRHIAAEWTSLSTEKLTAFRNDAEFWTPQKPGVEFKPIPGAPVPAATASRRLIQLRGLAKQFTVKAAERDRPDDFSDLRLLTRPVYRHESFEKDERDSAVFCFTLATDPEAILVLESRPTKDGPRWHYASARSTYRGLRLFHKDKMVWDVPQIAPPWSNLRNPDGTFRRIQWSSWEEASQ